MIQNAFTVDLEDWFQGLTSTNPQVKRWPTLESRVVYATELLLDILQHHHIRATFFVLGHVADHHPKLVARIAAAGHEIGLHGYWHRYVAHLTPAEFRSELVQGITAIERACGVTPTGHRAPYFSVNAQTTWAFDVIESLGLRYDSSVFPAKNMLYGFPGAPRRPYHLPNGLSEFPASVIRWQGLTLPIAGGFYVRALPYAVVRWGIRHLNADGVPAVMYIHPWELDTGQHYQQVTPRERLTHYYGRAGLSKKLERLFSDFKFGPLEDLNIVNSEHSVTLERSRVEH